MDRSASSELLLKPMQFNKADQKHGCNLNNQNVTIESIKPTKLKHGRRFIDLKLDFVKFDVSF